MPNDTVINGNTTTWTFVSGVSAKVEVITQQSVSSDASGVKLNGDSATPGNSKYYGTNSSGTKGFFDLPGGGGGSITVETQSGTPLVTGVTTIKVSDGTLTDDGGGVVSIVTGGGGGGGGGTVALKSADQSKTNDNTLANDPDLVFAIGANETWVLSGVLRWTAGDTAKFTFTVPVGATGFFQDIQYTFLEEPLGTPMLENLGGGVNIFISAQIINSTNAGNVQFQWAQNTSSPTTTTLGKFSYLVANKK